MRQLLKQLTTTGLAVWLGIVLLDRAVAQEATPIVRSGTPATPPSPSQSTVATPAQGQSRSTSDWIQTTPFVRYRRSAPFFQPRSWTTLTGASLEAKMDGFSQFQPGEHKVVLIAKALSGEVEKSVSCKELASESLEFLFNFNPLSAALPLNPEADRWIKFIPPVAAIDRRAIKALAQGDYGNKASDCYPNAAAVFLNWWADENWVPLPFDIKSTERRIEKIHTRLSRDAGTRNNSGTGTDALIGALKGWSTDLHARGREFTVLVDYNITPPRLAEHVSGENAVNATILVLSLGKKNGHAVALIDATPDGRIVFDTWGYRFYAQLVLRTNQRKSKTKAANGLPALDVIQREGHQLIRHQVWDIQLDETITERDAVRAFKRNGEWSLNSDRWDNVTIIQPVTAAP
jgi:hypothetical protein